MGLFGTAGYLSGIQKGSTLTTIAVTIPVGPFPSNTEFLGECLLSVLTQTRVPDEILFIDDSQGAWDFYQTLFALKMEPRFVSEVKGKYLYTVYVKGSRHPSFITRYATPWNSGVADAFNFGVGLAQADLVVMLGSDDTLYPDCLEELEKEYLKRNGAEGWYSFTYTVKEEIRTIPINAAAVTPGFFRLLGGFPPSAGVAACDALLLSIIMKHMPDKLYYVEQGRPLYDARQHAGQDTARNMGAYAGTGIVEGIRNIETARFKPRHD